MKDKLNDICVRLTDEISDSLSKCGLMYRIFSRVKTVDSIRHKLNVKYADKKVKIQDMIGIRIVLYFQDDVDALAVYYSAKDVVKKSIDEYDSSTFKPQRLNITRLIPEDMAEDFTAAVPEEFKELVEPTYEIQIRTVFSEGWHEVEHDLRYKCRNDWEGCDQYSRALNGVIATLETAEWNMRAIFSEMARHNFQHSDFTAMMRNKFHLKFRDHSISPELGAFLKSRRQLAEDVLNADRLIVVLSLLSHKGRFSLTYDNLLFLINRIEMMDPEMKKREPEDIKAMLDAYLRS
jgi:ppGpp synthetase/RelA/SpoT-type nucleotidyltranferase